MSLPAAVVAPSTRLTTCTWIVWWPSRSSRRTRLGSRGRGAVRARGPRRRRRSTTRTSARSATRAPSRTAPVPRHGAPPRRDASLVHRAAPGRLDPDEAIELARADALRPRGRARARHRPSRHEAGERLHRSPATAALPLVKLLDFGMCRRKAEQPLRRRTLTRAGTVVGTPEYMAPEQASGKREFDLPHRSLRRRRHALRGAHRHARVSRRQMRARSSSRCSTRQLPPRPLDSAPRSRRARPHRRARRRARSACSLRLGRPSSSTTSCTHARRSAGSAPRKRNARHRGLSSVRSPSGICRPASTPRAPRSAGRRPPETARINAY